ncbi:MAG: hypothetical protein V1752_00520 [Candidatus Firestonebacteria bacterium]
MRKIILIVILNFFPVIFFALTGWTDPFPVTNVSGSIQDFAFSVSSDRGNGLFSYACNGGSANNGIYFKNSTENSLTWSLNSFLSTVNNDALSPSVTGINGFIYNAWLDNNSGIYRVLLKKSPDGDNVELSGGANCSSVNIFAGSNGNVHAVWSENGIIYYRKGFNNGSNWSDIKTVSGAVSENPFVFEAGNLLVVLWREGVTFCAKYSSSGDGGLTWSGESSFSSAGIASLSCAGDSTGAVYAVWEQADKVYFRKHEASGWDMEKTISTNTAGTAKNPAVTIDTEGDIYVVWSDNRTGTNKIYLSSSVNGGQTFSSEIVLGQITLPGKLILASFKKNLYLLYKESGQIMYRIKDTSAPSPVSIKSPAYHPAGGGCNNNTPVFFLEVSDNDGGTGVKGYSFAFDKNAATVPPEVINYSSNTLTFPKTENGSWYLHVKAMDILGNWSETSHFNMVINNTSILPESEMWSAPNPVRSGQNPVIRYFVSDSSDMEMTVFNEAGDIMTSVRKNVLLGINEIKELDTRNWANGAYFYRIKVKSVQTGATAQLVKKILLLR